MRVVQAETNGSPPHFKEKIENAPLDKLVVLEKEEAGDFLALFTHPLLGVITRILALIWFFDSIGNAIWMWIPMYVSQTTPTSEPSSPDKASIRRPAPASSQRLGCSVFCERVVSVRV